VHPQRGKPRTVTATGERLYSIAELLAMGMDPVEADRLMMYGDPEAPKPRGVITA